MPIRLETAAKYTTVENLDHAFIFLPDQRKDIYVAKLLVDLGGSVCLQVFFNQYLEGSELSSDLC